MKYRLEKLLHDVDNIFKEIPTDTHVSLHLSDKYLSEILIEVFELEFFFYCYEHKRPLVNKSIEVSNKIYEFL